MTRYSYILYSNWYKLTCWPSCYLQALVLLALLALFVFLSLVFLIIKCMYVELFEMMGEMLIFCAFLFVYQRSWGLNRSTDFDE